MNIRLESASGRLLNPNSTAAVLLGAHDWRQAGLGSAPSFRRSACRVIQYFYDSFGLGLDPELIINLFDDPSSAGEQLSRINETLGELLHERRAENRQITDLIVYYIGHGHPDDHGQLSLLVRHSRKYSETETGIRTADLANILRRSAPQQRRCVILDCCFSERAVKSFFTMSSALDYQVATAAAADLVDNNPSRGTLVLCSSPTDRPSYGPPEAETTLFTGAVLDVIKKGVSGRPLYLSFEDLRDAAHERMILSFGANAPRPALHQPIQTHGDLTRIPAFLNRSDKLLRTAETEHQRREALGLAEVERQREEARLAAEGERLREETRKAAALKNLNVRTNKSISTEVSNKPKQGKVVFELMIVFILSIFINCSIFAIFVIISENIKTSLVDGARGIILLTIICILFFVSEFIWVSNINIRLVSKAKYFVFASIFPNLMLLCMILYMGNPGGIDDQLTKYFIVSFGILEIGIFSSLITWDLRRKTKIY